MTEQFANQARSALASAVSASAVSLSLTTTAHFPGSGTFRVVVDNEIMIVTAVSGVTYTVTRGAEGTVAASHAAGAEVVHVLTKASVEKFIEQISLAAVAALSPFDLKGSKNCSANPKYPAGVPGDTYLVSVAGKIGGSSGDSVKAGDLIVCITTSAEGTKAEVGTKWTIVAGLAPLEAEVLAREEAEAAVLTERNNHGVAVVVHGAEAGLARPTGYKIVIWVGTVKPTNIGENDLYFQQAP